MFSVFCFLFFFLLFLFFVVFLFSLSCFVVVFCFLFFVFCLFSLSCFCFLFFVFFPCLVLFMFFVGLGAGPTECNACAESDAATCSDNQRSQTCSSDPDSLGTTHCASAVGRYKDKSGEIKDGFIRGCVDCAGKRIKFIDISFTRSIIMDNEK